MRKAIWVGTQGIWGVKKFHAYCRKKILSRLAKIIKIYTHQSFADQPINPHQFPTATLAVGVSVCRV